MTDDAGPTYKVEFTVQAAKELGKLDGSVRPRIVHAIAALADDPRPAGCKALQGRDGFRVRIGNYRIIYEVDDGVLTVLVITIGHRSSVYR